MDFAFMRMAKQYDLIVKILLIGDSGVGKTCMICKFAEEEFNDKPGSTVGIDFKMKSVNVDGKKVRIQLWDTAGQERYDTITKQYYRRAQGIFLVFDITSETSFKSLEKWFNNAKEYGAEDVELMILANKTDISQKRKVTTDTGQQLAKRLNVPYCETSAKGNSDNLEKVFLTMATTVMEKHKREYDRISLHLEREDSDGGEYVSELLRPQEKESCC